MRCLLLFVCFSLFLLLNDVCNSHCSPSSPPLPQQLGDKQTLINNNHNHFCNKTCQYEINLRNILQISIFGFGLFILLWKSYLHLCDQVCFVAFNSNLSLYNKKRHKNHLSSFGCISLLFCQGSSSVKVRKTCSFYFLSVQIQISLMYICCSWNLENRSHGPYLPLYLFTFFLLLLHRLITFFKKSLPCL